MDDFGSFIDSIRLNVNRHLKKIPIPYTPRYLYDPIKYSIRDGGKRFRPILTHLSGRANNIDSDALMKLSIAVELLHNFTLVHDDIMDNDTIRHGKQTIHEKWDSSTAILAGDGIYTIAQIILNEISFNSILLSKYFNKTTLEICEGQALDKEFENDHDIDRKMYFDMINKKTGSLLGASAALPIIHNNGSEEQVYVYEQFGRNLGMGFQIHDDLLEITADTETMGKSLGSDIFEGKQTIMVILARESYPDEWRDILNLSENNELIKNIYNFFKAKSIIQETRSISDAYFEASLNFLKKLDGIYTEELVQLVHLIKKRTF